MLLLKVIATWPRRDNLLILNEHYGRLSEMTLADLYPPTAQREALLKLAEALGSRDVCLCRDDCGDWCIKGRDGHIYAVPGMLQRPGVKGFQLVVGTQSARAWGFAKTALSFCLLTNDGDEEGTLFLDRLPTAEEAAVIRDKLHIPKRREISEAERARLAGMGHRFSSRQDDVVDEIRPPTPPQNDAPMPEGPKGP
jgi:hypothetical protein